MKTLHVVTLFSVLAMSAFADEALTFAVDRSTPAASVQGFFDHAHNGNYAVAARYLNLDHTPKEKRLAEGPRLARRLRFVLDRKLFIDYSTLSHEESGDPADGKTETLGTLQLKNAKQPIRLQRVPSEDGPGWIFSDDTVRSIDRLYQEFGPPLGETLPAFWFDSHFLGLELWQWIGLLAVLLAASVIGWVLGKIVILIAERMARITAWGWDDRMIVGARGPVRLVIWCVLVASGSRLLYLTPMAQLLLDLIARSTLILAITLFALRSITAVSNYVQTEVKGTAEGIERARRLRTQVAVLKGVLQVAIYVIAAALLLMQFAVVRSVGVSLLASAGIAGLVIGLAAQKSISNLLAGIQLSLTQPIQIGESIVVEGEFGVVEEIRLTYVVISVWDGRRLIIPITQFLDKPFQNWSRARNGLLG
ncbi:MAG: mechanosensitive ion channel family protein, partial [Myxococcaceae bacterium]